MTERRFLVHDRILQVRFGEGWFAGLRESSGLWFTSSVKKRIHDLKVFKITGMPVLFFEKVWFGGGGADGPKAAEADGIECSIPIFAMSEFCLVP